MGKKKKRGREFDAVLTLNINDKAHRKREQETPIVMIKKKE